MYYQKQLHCVIFDFYKIVDGALKAALDEGANSMIFDPAEEKINIRSIQLKNLIRHYVIFETCEAILKCDMQGTKVIYCQLPIATPTGYIFEIAEVDEDAYRQFVERLFKDIGKYLPIVIFSSEYDYKQVKVLLDNPDSGESQEFINLLLSTINTFDSTSYTFQNIRKYAKNHRLNFLSSEYFSQFRSKKLLYHR